MGLYSFLLVRYSCQLSAGVLHALLCLKVYSSCICVEKCTPHPPTPLPSLNPSPLLLSPFTLSFSRNILSLIFLRDCLLLFCFLFCFVFVYSDSSEPEWKRVVGKMLVSHESLRSGRGILYLTAVPHKCFHFSPGGLAPGPQSPIPSPYSNAGLGAGAACLK